MGETNMASRLSALNDPPKVLEGPQLLHGLIDFELHADACALDFSSNERRIHYSYHEIQRSAQSLANTIEDGLGASREPDSIRSSRQHIIPILLPQSPALYVAQLAILESGGAFCPINLDAPKERVKFVTSDVKADVIITTPDLQHVATWEDGPKIILIDDFPVIPKAKSPRRAPSREPKAQDLAYVMYTSGSSGTPKGVAVSHLAASQSLLAHERHIPQFKRFLQFAAPSFDVSVFEIFFPLKRGATLVGCNRSQLLDDLPGVINDLQIDAAELTPTVAGSLLQKRSNAPGLKLLLTIGEMLTRPIVEEFGGSETKESMLYGMYGPTEAAIHCTINPKMSAISSPSNIGVPLDTVSTFVAAADPTAGDGGLHILGTGELGELVLGGPQLAEGYLNREEQNKAAFIRSSGRNYYRTGDKARFLEDGTIEILGRMSAGQVKLRGQRIELGEIEEAVYRHPSVKTASAAVIANVLIVFALVGDQSLKPEDISEICAKWLPKFMIPSEIILQQQFPYLPSGKIDKRKLQSDYEKRLLEDTSDDEFSSTAAEVAVKEIIKNLLGCFSKHMRLAAAGLDSLVAIRVASRLRESGFNVSTIAVLQAETPVSLAKICGSSASTNSQPSNSTPKPTPKASFSRGFGGLEDAEFSIPCTPLQSAMLFETLSDQKAYRNWIELDLSNIIGSDQVISALQSLAECNPILRTGFIETENGEGFAQVVWKSFDAILIDNVEELVYNFDPSKDASLLHPMRIQIQNRTSSTRVLIHIHHALYDAWSVELLLDDLDVLLLNQKPIQRPDFASLVSGYLDGTIGSDAWASRDYWKDHLAHLELRQIPNFNTQRISSTSLAVAKLETSISTSDVETAARSLSSSPQSLFQAAYALVLSSYLGSSDICFGTVFSGRTLPLAGIEDIAGPCLSTLPIRVDISTSSTLQDLVRQLNSTNRKHLEYSALPLRDIKSTAGVDPRLALFDTLLIWQQTLHSYDQKRSHVVLVDSTDNLEFNLTLEIIPGLGNVVLKANYRESLLPQSQIEILLRQLEQLSKTIIEKCATSLEDVFSNLSSDLQSLQNETPQLMPSVETLSSPVERMAAEDPERLAIDFATSIDGDDIALQSLSYFELNSRSNQIAHHLTKSGLLPDELICICMEKSVDLYTSILAATKFGAGYLPITPDTPLERLVHILEETNVRFIIAHSSSKSMFQSLTAKKIIYVDDIDLSALSSENISSRYSPDSLAYSVFTSGSTGKPKGVLVTRGNLASNLDALEELYPATKTSRLLQSCSQAFDVSVFEIFFTWRIGACLCSATKDVLFRDIESAIRMLHVTHLSLTPTVAALVDPRNLPEVKFLVTAGEAVTQKVFNAWSDSGLYQGYGPSETTNICTVNPRVSSDDLINNIGPPLKNTSAFVLSPGSDFKILPRGAEGELCFGGSQVFRGYVNRSQELGKIITHPKFGRLYRSGDFGRLMPDGCLVFTGRKDDQVKVRGQRVELGEINATMLRSPEVSDCVTLVLDESTNRSQRLVSFWTAGTQSSQTVDSLPPNSSTISQLYHTLEAAVPEYMIPSSLIPLSCLPRTSQGKIDKRALVAIYETLDLNYLDSASRAAKQFSEHEWTELERSIAEALSSLVDYPMHEINADTSFFSLGIDSVSAISFSKVLRQVTNLPVEISDVLKYPSASRLAERISGKSENARDLLEAKGVDFGFQRELVDATIARFSRAGRKVQSILPCTPLQEAMLSAGGSSHEKLYSNQVVFEVRCDVEKLQSCWQEMTKRHGILRTCFIDTDMPQYPFAQVVLEKFEMKFHTADNIENLKLRWNELDPPYKFHLIEHSGTTQLILSMHHALYDGVALSVLYEEVESLYRAEDLPPACTFLPFLHTMASLSVEKSDMFWAQALENSLPSRLPTTNSQVPRSQNEASVQHIYSSSPLSWIEKSVKRHNTTLLATCHAVWAGLLAEILKVGDVCFGNVVSGRTFPIQGLERLVAPCFNTIPSRLQDVHKLSYLEAFRLLQSQNADSLEFQLTPLRRIQSKFSIDGMRLFDTLFILQQPAQDLDSSIWSITEDDGVMDFPLVCEVIPRHSKNSLEIIVHSHSSAITRQDAFSLLNTFNTRLQTALENPRHQLLSSDMREEIILRTMEMESSSLERSEDATSTEMTQAELRLRGILADFTNFNPTKIGRDTSIFRIGLDSISAVQIAARLRKLGHNVTGSDILQHPTISRLSAHICSHVNAAANETYEYDFVDFDSKFRSAICSKYAIPSRVVGSIRACTTVQQGMLARSIYSQGEEYVNSMWFELPQASILSAFKNAWKVTCAKHDMLRTGFAETNDAAYPFAMITYINDSFELPWFEDIDDSAAKFSIVHKLSQPSWALYVQKHDSQTLVRFIAHHALYDAQSIQMILTDVSKVYNSDLAITRSPINNLLGAILKDYDTDLLSKKQFWEREENKIIVNRFPNLTPLRVSTTKTLVEETVSSASIAELEEHCKQNGVTMQAASQAAWARLLSAYTGEISTTFGMTLSGRSIVEDAYSIPFPSIITLPVRCDVSGTNSELLSRTMDSNALLHRYQFTPLTSIQKWAGYPERKIFDTLFAYQKLSGSDPELELPFRVVKEEATVDYSVSMEVQPTPSGRIILRLTSKKDTIPTEHANLLLQQYDILLQDTLYNPQRRCDIAPDASAHLLSITPAKENQLPSPVKLLHEFVERGAEKWPLRNAFEFATRLGQAKKIQSWTYSDLNKEGNKVAQFLSLQNVIQGSIVGICFDKCPEASFAILGVLKAGCGYVALDPHAPLDRLKFIVEDSGASLILSAGETSKRLQSHINADVVALDACDQFKSCSSNQPSLRRCIQPADTSYCLYTSGTTGTPKGCLISHENSVQAMLSFQRLFAGHWDFDSKWLQFASFHFDVSVLEQFWSWSVGICVCSAPRDLIFEDIPNAIRQLGVTHIDLTPSLARLLQPEDVPSLCRGVFITGGEQLKQEILDAWGDHACIYNGYGPTEATIGVTMYPRVPKNGKPDNIGPQFDNVGSFVLKPGTALPVLRGGVGELCVSGRLVGKGYLKRSDLTSERFPTLPTFHERVYRTGDLVRILHDGSFLFLGRSDDQVKLRGQRLELSEINEVIKKSKGDIQEVVTLVLKHNAQQKEQLVTFFVSTLDRAVDISDVILTMKSACRARLPGYMVPTHFVPIETLPLNANNKADVRQLAAAYNKLSIADLQRLSYTGQEGEKWTDSEKEVIKIIAPLLCVDATTLTKGSTIFQLGLDSISIIAFSRSLQDSGIANATLSVVKSNPDIGSLVKALVDNSKTNHAAVSDHVLSIQEILAFSQIHMMSIISELHVERNDIESIAPCTPVQEGMIYRFLESNELLYFNRFEFILDHKANIDKIFYSWQKAIANLEILRTKFVATDDGYAQVVLTEPNIRGWQDPTINFATTDKATLLKEPFHVHFTFGTQRRMVINIFHGLYDGNSLSRLLQCVIGEYHDSKIVEYGPSFHSSLPYGPLGRVGGARTFWSNHLQNWEDIKLPMKSIPVRNDITATRVISHLDGLEEFRRKVGTTHQAIVQAVWISVLRRVFSLDLTIGVVISGRAIDFNGADKVIGPLFNTVPFAIKVAPDTTLASIISTCHSFNMQMQGYQHTPLKDIQKWASCSPGQSLFDSLFVFQRSDINVEDASDLWTQVDNEPSADYPLAFEANLNPDGTMQMTIVAEGSIVAQSDAETILGQVESLLVTTLKEQGSNTIAFSTMNNRTEENLEIRGSNVQAIAERSPNTRPFSWTKESSQLRYEISSLANVDEMAINEHSSIFELGLDSIDMIKLSSRLKRHHIFLAVSTIIKCQSVAKMASHIQSSSVGDVVTNDSLGYIRKLSDDLSDYLDHRQLIPAKSEVVLPATPLQETMINEMLKSNFQRYFTIEVFKLGKETEGARLMAAVKSVIKKTPVLRTIFIKVDDPKSPVNFAQVILESHEHISESAEPDLDEFLTNFRIKSRARAASSGSLFHVHIVSTKGGSYMVWAISHALYDGTSLRLLHHDIEQEYKGKHISRPDYVPLLNQVLNSTTSEAKRFWSAALSDLPRATFPERNISLTSDSIAVFRSEGLSHVPLDAVEKLCKSSKVTLQTLGQTCWALLLAHLMGQLDVVFGTVLSCRDSETSNDMMFPLMNTIAVRSIIHGTLSEMLKYMQDISDRSRQYQHFPLGAAQALALSSRDGTVPADTKFFNTLFIYQGRHAKQTGGSLYDSVQGISDVEFPVCVEMEIVDNQLAWTTACKSTVRGRIDADTIVEMLDTILHRIISTSDVSAVVSNSSGVSICGLPPFRMAESKKSIPRSPLAANEADWSDTELLIRSALHRISGVPEDEIHKTSTIFQLGLDSIVILKIPALIKAHGITLSVSDILKCQTPSAMAKTALEKGSMQTTPVNIDTALSDALSALDPTILQSLESEVGGIEYVLPATPGQKYMIRLWQSSRGVLFFPSFTYYMESSVDQLRLKSAWNSLLNHHDILRTGFVEEKSAIFQVIYKVSTTFDKAGHSKPAFPDLKRPPVALVIENQSGSCQRLKLVIHHALYDGISLPMLMRDLQLLYQGQAIPSAVNLKSFVAKSLNAQNQASGTEPNSSLTETRWKSYLDATYLVQDIFNDSFHDSNEERIELFQPANKVSPLKQVAQDIGVSIDAVLLASLSKVYARLLRRPDTESISNVAFGIYLANRAPFGDDLSSIAVPTLNILPLSVRDPLARKIEDIAVDLQGDLRKISNEDMSCASLEDIYEWTGVRVNFIVNILKDSSSDSDVSDDALFKPDQDLKPKSEVVKYSSRDMEPSVDNKLDAYIPSIDVEIRLQKDTIDMGVFAPSSMLSLDDAESMIERFVELLA